MTDEKLRELVILLQGVNDLLWHCVEDLNRRVLILEGKPPNPYRLDQATALQ